MNENESLTVTLTLDNDEELECAVLTIFETEGQEYIALLPLNEDGNSDDGQVYLYRFINNGEDAEPDLENIEDDAEFDHVSEAFNEWMEEQDFGELSGSFYLGRGMANKKMLVSSFLLASVLAFLYGILPSFASRINTV